MLGPTTIGQRWKNRGISKHINYHTNFLKRPKEWGGVVDIPSPTQKPLCDNFSISLMSSNNAAWYTCVEWSVQGRFWAWGQKAEDGENKVIHPKRAAWNLGNVFSQDGVNEMTRIASCFIPCKQLVFLFLFSNRQLSQTPCLYNNVFLIGASKYPTLCTNAHNMINPMALINDREWCEPTFVYPIVAPRPPLHPFRVATFIISRFGSMQEPFYPSLVHRYWSFTIFGFSTLIGQNLDVSKSSWCACCDLSVFSSFNSCILYRL